MGKRLLADFGPGIVGWAGEVDGSMVCIAALQVDYDPSARRDMRELVQRKGGDCDSCRGCPIGQLSS
jgi:hypothetical protein